jgi:hypothetical protein
MNDRLPINQRVFWPMALIGVAVMAFGVFGLFEDSARTHPSEWVRWFVGAVIAHDFVLAPAVATIGVVSSRRVPARFRAIVQGALVASGIVLLIAYPFVRGYGRSEDNPSILPNNYAFGSLVVLGVIWGVAGALAWRVNHRRAE